MNNQEIETQNGNSQEPAIDKLVSPLQAHVIGVAAVALAIALNWLFNLDIKMQHTLWLVAFVVYANLYREANKEKFER